MKERKEKIKNIAIVFLVIMLILTFFSNTIMNYSLVEVSTQMVSSGSLTSKVRGSGIVEASDSYNVTISESRKIATVEVKTGAKVETGDVLFTLEDSDSAELQEAEKNLLTMKNDYQTAVLNAGFTASELAAIENTGGSTLAEKQATIAGLLGAIDSAQAAVDTAQEKVDGLSAQQEALSNTTVDTSAEQKAVNDAQTAVNNAQSAQIEAGTKVANINAQMSAYDTANLSEEEQKAYDELKSQLVTATIEKNNADATLESAQNTLTNAQSALSAKQNSTNTAQANSIANQLTTAKAELAAAQETLDAAKADYDEVSAKLLAEISIAAQYQSILEQEELVEELRANAIDTQVVAPISGTVTEIVYTAGQTVTPNEAMALIQPENKAFTLSFQVTSNQAKKIKIGDTAEILNNWYGADISAQVSGIRINPQDRQSTTIVCTLSGEVSVGDSYTVSIGNKSSNYDTIVPSSAIREDSNGKFILIIRAKSTPLGNRYYAERVDVEVITSDDSQSAVSGALEGGEFVITTTTKPVEAGQQVRLAENGN